MLRLPRIVLMAFAISPLAACEHVQFNPAPFSLSTSQEERPLSELRTSELCERRHVAFGWSQSMDALNELDDRGEFTPAEMQRIYAGNLEPGMREAAVRCVMKWPPTGGKVVRNEDHDQIMRWGDLNVYLKDDVVVRIAREDVEPRPSLYAGPTESLSPQREPACGACTNILGP
jgi:hypothetical protein